MADESKPNKLVLTVYDLITNHEYVARSIKEFLGRSTGVVFVLGSVDVKSLLDELTNEQRAEIISKYCRCGSKDTSCQCWDVLR